jgi:chromosome segregation ATPase
MLAVADNSAALRRARRRDSQAKRRRAAAAIEAIVESGEPISFPAVARRAGVSVSLLYADPDLSARIAAAHDRQRQAGHERAWQLPARSLVTEQSLRAELANAKDQARRLADEVTTLRDRLAHQLGAEADIASGRTLSPLLDRLEQRAADLEADNAQLHQRIALLEGQARELTETLEAARAMNRELMGELNRGAAGPDEPARPRSRRRS